MIVADSNIYIYFLEKNPDFYDVSDRAIGYALENGIIPVPTITIMEILSGSPSQKVLNFFANDHFKLVDLTTDMAALAGELRYRHGSLRATDAIHLATALTSGANQFITNDDRLAKLELGIEIVPLSRFQ